MVIGFTSCQNKTDTIPVANNTTNTTVSKDIQPAKMSENTNSETQKVEENKEASKEQEKPSEDKTSSNNADAIKQNKTTTKPATPKTTTTTNKTTTTTQKPTNNTTSTTSSTNKNTSNVITVERKTLPSLPQNKAFTYEGELEKQILVYTNKEREKAGLKPLVWEEQMRSIARWKSNAMLQLDYFEHENPNLNGASSYELATKYFGYNTNGYGENLYFSQGIDETAEGIVNAWMDSPGHRANILNPKWTKMAAGVVKSGDVYYATQHFSSK